MLMPIKTLKISNVSKWMATILKINKTDYLSKFEIFEPNLAKTCKKSF